MYLLHRSSVARPQGRIEGGYGERKKSLFYSHCKWPRLYVEFMAMTAQDSHYLPSNLCPCELGKALPRSEIRLQKHPALATQSLGKVQTARELPSAPMQSLRMFSGPIFSE
jgi:hypothetical protein